MEFLDTIKLKHIFISVIIAFIILFLRTCSIDEGVHITQMKKLQDSIFMELQDVNQTQNLLLNKIEQLGIDTEANLITYFLYKEDLTRSSNEIIALKEKLKVLKEIKAKADEEARKQESLD